MQPPLLGNCQYDKMYVTANGDYPLLCGQNSGKTYIFIVIKVTSDYILCLGLSSLGVPGVPWHTQFLADQLTLFQPGGTNYAHLITTHTACI